MSEATDINEVKFNDELTSFADDFSQKYRDITPGIYKSERDVYCIRYLHKLTDSEGKHLNTVARIGHSSGNIELDRSKLVNPVFTPDFVYFIILWCWACIYNPHKEAITDTLTWDFCFNSDKNHRKLSKKNVIMGFLAIMKGADTPANRKRWEKLKCQLG